MTEIKWRDSKGSESISGPNADYQKNFNTSLEFIKKIANKLLPGMKVYLSDSHDLKKNLLWVVWEPGRYEKIGNQANPISLHQTKTAFDKELEWTFSKIYNIAKNWMDKKKVKVVQMGLGLSETAIESNIMRMGVQAVDF